MKEEPLQEEPPTCMHSRRRTTDPTPQLTLQGGSLHGPHMDVEQAVESQATVSSSKPMQFPRPAVPPVKKMQKSFIQAGIMPNTRPQILVDRCLCEHR